MESKIRIAIQKSGRLSEDSLLLFKESGIKLNNGIKKLMASSHNFPVEFLFLRDDDIPGYVADGVADLGIVGENEVVEKNRFVKIIKPLGFSKCRLSIAIPKEEQYNSVKDLDGKSIATSYPIILGDYLKKHNLTCEIHEISGSVEIAPGIGLADAICDIVSSGSTLFSNGLKEVEQVFKSEAVLIGNPLMSAEKKVILDRLLFRFGAVRQANENKYVLLNAPNNKVDKIISILPGMKSPTVLPLAVTGWSSIHSVINEDKFWDIIEQLKAEGAEGILVIPIEKMVV
jgi:ATP phosphoribosyltransferase